ncbi:hypothetical protein DFH29DRAFT_1071801, partial [Suillus ampliporus]
MDLDLASLRLLQFWNYVLVSLTVFWVCDCFLTLDQEMSLVHELLWKKGSVLYVMTRYFPAFLLCVHIYLNHLQNEHFVTCNSLHTVWYCASALCVASTEGIFILRTYALWGHKKSILGLMLSTVLVRIRPPAFHTLTHLLVWAPQCLVILDVVMTTAITSQLELQLSGWGWGCYSLSRNKMAAAPWTLLVAFELEIVVLTMIRVYWTYRERRCLLLDILLHHNIFYFVTGLTLSVVNILAIVCLPYNP